MQVDYQSTAEELGQHFQSCGAINRVTILCDKYTGNPKGCVCVCHCTYVCYKVCHFRFAYVEFVDKSSVTQAVELDESLFKGRQIKVIQVLVQWNPVCIVQWSPFGPSKIAAMEKCESRASFHGGGQSPVSVHRSLGLFSGTGSPPSYTVSIITDRCRVAFFFLSPIRLVRNAQTNQDSALLTEVGVGEEGGVVGFAAATILIWEA